MSSIGDKEELVYEREHAVWLPLHQEGFAVMLKGKSWHLPVAHPPDGHQGVPQAWLRAHSRTDKVETLVFLYVLQWIILLPGFWQESSPKTKMAVDDQRGNPIGTVYREYSTQTKNVMTPLLFFDSNAENTDQQDGGFQVCFFLLKKKKSKHFPVISTWHALSSVLEKKKYPRKPQCEKHPRLIGS